MGNSVSLSGSPPMAPCATPPPQEFLPRFDRTMVILRADGTNELAAQITPAERDYMTVVAAPGAPPLRPLILGVDRRGGRPNAFPFAPPLRGDVYVYNATGAEEFSGESAVFTAPRNVISKMTWADIIRN